MLWKLLITSSLGLIAASLVTTACGTISYKTADRTPTSEIPSSVSSSGYMFDWPVDAARLTRGFLPRTSRFRKRPHLGIDLAARSGSPIYAAQDGRVIYVGQQFTGYGRIIMIEGAQGWASFYAHLSATRIREGVYVHKGQLIGLMGRTGRATGVHLHFELRKNRIPVDPLLYLPGASRLATR